MVVCPPCLHQYDRSDSGTRPAISGLSVPLWNSWLAMDLNEMLVFARVVQAGSFTTAAAQLGMPKSTVSRKVAELEERLNARLLNRTTRKLSLTDVGRTYLRLLRAHRQRDRRRRARRQQPAGHAARPPARDRAGQLRLPRPHRQRLPRALPGGARRALLHGAPGGSRRGAIRRRASGRARSPDSTLIARSLGTVTWFLVATPAYLKKRGRPRSPDDLKKHDCLLFGTGSRLRCASKAATNRAGESVTRLLVERHATSFARRRSPAWASRCCPRSGAWRTCARAASSACCPAGRAGDARPHRLPEHAPHLAQGEELRRHSRSG